MHHPALQPADEFALRPPRGLHPTAAFSLVEVTLAIGIIAFAFVALFSLLPIGLQRLRDSIDTASEAWIMQGLNSMVQTTEWEKVYPGGANGITGDTYYFDEEARLTDTENNQSSADLVRSRRLYAVRLFVVPLKQPGTTELITRDGTNPVLVQVIAVMARMIDSAKTPDQLKSLVEADLAKLGRNSNLRVSSFVATQLNANR